MAYCPNCGKKIDDGIKFCPNCGNAINPQVVVNATSNKVSKPKKKMVWTTILCILVWIPVLILLIMGISEVDGSIWDIAGEAYGVTKTDIYSIFPEVEPIEVFDGIVNLVTCGLLIVGTIITICRKKVGPILLVGAHFVFPIGNLIYNIMMINFCRSVPNPPSDPNLTALIILWVASVVLGAINAIYFWRKRDQFE